MRAFDDIRKALRQAGITPARSCSRPYFATAIRPRPCGCPISTLSPGPPIARTGRRTSARDPQNMPWPNMGCATQRNLAAMVDDPDDLVEPRGETPRPGERRDVVWGKYVEGRDDRISKRSPSPSMPTRAT